MPFRRLSFKNATHLTPYEHLSLRISVLLNLCRMPHLWEGRTITPGQKIHASVALIDGYTPKAKFHSSMKTTTSWSDLLKAPSGHQRQSDVDIFDSDSFYLDTSKVPKLLRDFTKPTKGSLSYDENVSTLDILTKYAWTGTFLVSLPT